MNNVPTSDPLFSQLTKVIWANNCVAFIGAGMSVPDYPKWDDLMARLKNEYGPVDSLQKGDSHAQTAEKLKASDETKYWRVLRTIFERKKSPKTAERYHLLARIPFLCYVTTNFDPLLYDYLDCHHNIEYSEYDWLEPDILSPRDTDPRELACIHGRFAPENGDGVVPQIVFTDPEYKRAYRKRGSKLDALLLTLFTQKNVCFMGCGTDDEYLKEVLAICRQVRSDHPDLKNANATHLYMLLHDNAFVPPNFEEEHGIRIVRYPQINKRHAGLDTVLEHWAKKEPPRVRSRPHASLSPRLFESEQEREKS